jgi:hypothetical protein
LELVQRPENASRFGTLGVFAAKIRMGRSLGPMSASRGIPGGREAKWSGTAVNRVFPSCFFTLPEALSIGSRAISASPRNTRKVAKAEVDHHARDNDARVGGVGPPARRARDGAPSPPPAILFLFFARS